MRAPAYADGFRAEAKIDEPHAHRPPASTKACSSPISPLNTASNAAGYGSVEMWLSRDLIVRAHAPNEQLGSISWVTAEFLRASGFSADRASLRWVADPEVTLGGCMLRSSEGALDARLEVQLQALKASLVTTRASRRHLAALPPALPVTPPTALPAGEPPP